MHAHFKLNHDSQKRPFNTIDAMLFTQLSVWRAKKVALGKRRMNNVDKDIDKNKKQ